MSRRSELAAELRGLRSLAGVSGRDLAKRIGVSQSKLSRIENGTTMPSFPEVQAWGRELGTSAGVQQRLAIMTEAAHFEMRSWRVALQRQGHIQHEILEKESGALRVRVYQSSVVPGLLQTPEYMRQVFSMFQIPYSDKDLAAAVAARLDRQLALYSGAKRYEFLVTEGALRWRPGPVELLVTQLERIAQVGTLSNVSVGVIPQNIEALTFTSHGFVLYDNDENSEVSLETTHADIRITAPEDVRLYDKRWELLCRMATFGDDALSFLSRLVADIKASGT